MFLQYIVSRPWSIYYMNTTSNMKGVEYTYNFVIMNILFVDFSQ